MSQNAQSGAAAPRPLGVLLRGQVQAHGHAPLLTYYGAASGERTELSFATFDNWASKTANLFVEELGLRRGGRVLSAVTDHWIGAVVLAAAWKVGARVVLDGEGVPAADVAVLPEAALPPGAEDRPGLVVVGTGIGGRVSGDPPGVAYGDEVLAFADDYDDPAVAADDVAVEHAGALRTHLDLAQDVGLRADDRLLVTDTLRDTLAVVTVPAVCGAAIVWCPGGEAAAHAADERCTHVLTDAVIRPL